MSDMAATPPPPPMSAPGFGPVGTVRNPLVVILLGIVTCGIYTLYWYYAVHTELKNHTGEGLGGPVALIIAFFVSPVMLFLTPHEVGKMYEKAGQPAPTSWKTFFWILIPIAGAFIYIYKVQGAMNARWSGQA